MRPLSVAAPRVAVRAAAVATVVAGVLATATACGPRAPAKIGFVPVPASSGLRFRHELPCGKLDTLPKSAMGGVAVTDLDGDGLPDVFCVHGGWSEKYAGCERPAKTAHHRLFRNLGGMKFEDVTERAGVGFDGFGMGVCVGDIEGDGRPDLFVAQYGASLLLRNRGDGTFEDVAAKAGIAPGFGAGAAFLDYDRDGDLDLFVGQYVDTDQVELGGMGHQAMGDTFPGPAAYQAQPSRLYRNRGDGTFEDVSIPAGIAKPGKAMGVVATDIDGDGWIDVLVANDAMRNFVWRNAGNGTFTDIGATTGLAFGANAEDRASMGVTVADLDGDGRRDVLMPDTAGGAAYRALDHGFGERASEWGLPAMSRGYVGWADVGFDADNDGRTDLYRVHGDLRTLQPQPCFVARNFDGEHFERLEAVVGGPESVGEIQAAGRAAVAADLDADGREDLVVSVLDGTMRVFRNVTEDGGNWVAVRVAGKAPNPLAIGTIVRGRAGKRALVREVTGSTGYISAGDLKLHFGLGDAGSLDDVVIRWPDGTEQRAGDLAAGREHVISRK